MHKVVEYKEFNVSHIIESSLVKLDYLLEYEGFRAGDQVEWDYSDGVEGELEVVFKQIKNNKKESKSYLRQVVNKIKKSSSNKKLIIYAAITAMLTGGLSKSDIEDSVGNDIDSDVVVNNIEARNISIDDIRETLFIPEKPYHEFLEDLAFSESSGDWTKVKYDSYGKPMYIGKYQFSKIALKDIRLKIDMDEFEKNPNIWPEAEQDKAVRNLFKNNWRYLRKYHKYEGDIVDGNKLTKSGMLAASHLVGHRALKKYIDSNGKINLADGNGVTVEDYLTEFANYKVRL